jgi:ketol-acid reductoisomerase
VPVLYHDEHAELAALKEQTVAVIGYGNQGRAQALNLRDSGVEVVVGNIADAARMQAEADGLPAVAIPEACRRADVVMLLIPDEVMPEVYARDVAPHLAAGMLLDFASGYNVAFGLIEPPQTIDVVLVAPRMIGPGVRVVYERGAGFPSFVGVHRDATGTARARMLALARGIGSTRAGCIEMSMHDEASLDLFTEQAFGPAFGRVLITAIETLVNAGYPPEAVLLELYLSGELAYTLEKMREVGMMRQMDFHSRTSQYGSITRSARFVEFAEPLGTKMHEVLEEIRSGRFAEEWSRRQTAAAKLLEAARAAREQLPLAQWENRTRRAFRIGDAAPDGGES